MPGLAPTRWRQGRAARWPVCLRITDSPESRVRPFVGSMAAEATLRGAAAETPIEAGPVEVHARVELTASLE